MDIEIIMQGNSPLLHHNPQMVDPDFELNRQIKALTSKRKKTEEDNRKIEWLEWHGGLYTGVVQGREVITQPCAKVLKCLVNAARITKQGKQVERALIITELNAAQVYEGSDAVKDIRAEQERLYAIGAFKSRLSVVVSRKRVMRVRPQFAPWALVVPMVFLPDAGLNFDELQRIVELAGSAERIGDNRVNGYGAFRGHARAVTAATKPVRPTIASVRDFFDNLDKQEEAA